MSDPSFYLRVLSAEYGATIEPADLKSRHPRIVVRVGKYFETNPLSSGAAYSHYRPARWLAANSGKWQIPKATLEHFETAFSELNELLT